MDVVTLEKRGSSPAVLLGPASGKGLSVFSALSGNDRELSPLAARPLQKVQVEPIFNEYSIRCSEFLVICQVKGLFLCHSS